MSFQSGCYYGKLCYSTLLSFNSLLKVKKNHWNKYELHSHTAEKTPQVSNIVLAFESPNSTCKVGLL